MAGVEAARERRDAEDGGTLRACPRRSASRSAARAASASDAAARIEAWIAAYERAWRTAGTESLRELFAEGATYRMSPYEEPASGLAEIGALWERERRAPTRSSR